MHGTILNHYNNKHESFCSILTLTSHITWPSHLIPCITLLSLSYYSLIALLPLTSLLDNHCVTHLLLTLALATYVSTCHLRVAHLFLTCTRRIRSLGLTSTMCTTSREPSGLRASQTLPQWPRTPDIEQFWRGSREQIWALFQPFHFVQGHRLHRINSEFCGPRSSGRETTQSAEIASFQSVSRDLQKFRIVLCLLVSEGHADFVW